MAAGFGRHLAAILALPVTVTGVLSAMLLRVGTRVNLPWPVRWAGVPLVVAGLGLVVATIRHFVRSGDGTLAPWDPTRRLVVDGIYRRVRNPMISGVLALLLGEAVVSASPAVFWLFVSAAALNGVYIPFVEEPGLERRFGGEYVAYRRSTPRWIPRLSRCA